MKCECGHATNVTDGRYVPEGYWRKRKCDHCGASFTTVEQVCETIKGTRVRQPVVKVPKPAVVKAPRERKKQAKVKPKQVAFSPADISAAIAAYQGKT